MPKLNVRIYNCRRFLVFSSVSSFEFISLTAPHKRNQNIGTQTLSNVFATFTFKLIINSNKFTRKPLTLWSQIRLRY